MADNKWHLVSTFDRTQTLEEFCNSINFTIDSDEKYIYRIRDGIEATEQVKKVNWYRITIKDDDSNNVGKIDIYNDDDDGSWEEDSTIENETNLIPRTSYWMYGEKGDKIKGRWGSLGKGSGEIKIESILLSPYYLSFSGAIYVSELRNIYAVSTVIRFRNNEEITFTSFIKEQTFKHFEYIFNETKNSNGEVSFIDFNNCEYTVVDKANLSHSSAETFWFRIMPNGTTFEGVWNRSHGPFTKAQDAWNAMFCFIQLPPNFDKGSGTKDLQGQWELNRETSNLDSDDMQHNGRSLTKFVYWRYAHLLAMDDDSPTDLSISRANETTTITGKAKPDSTVTIYHMENKLGEGNVSTDGTFSIEFVDNHFLVSAFVTKEDGYVSSASSLQNPFWVNNY